MSTAFPLLGEPLGLDLANTLVRANGPNPQDLLANTASLMNWLRARATATGDDRADARAVESVTESDLAQVRALRADISTLLAAHAAGTSPSAGAVARVNRAARAGAPQLVWEEPGAPVRARGSLVADLVAQAAATTIEALTEAPTRLKVCAHPDCTLWFRGANTRRMWCSTATCGNRARAARHYQRTVHR
ncbi:MAG: CGNR zinc finger domain-containing protein [Dermatophilaceae bacterium]